jgi:uncharacterized protein (DUF362 family)
MEEDVMRRSDKEPGQSPLLTRREFLETGLKSAACFAAGSVIPLSLGCAPAEGKTAVSIVKIKNDNVGLAVEEAIDLLGGIKSITKNKQKIMLKPNLVAPLPEATTKPEVIKTLAKLLLGAGKEVVIGEGTAASPPFNVQGGEVFRTSKRDLLDKMQKFTFDSLGYTELGKSLGIPLVNLHSGELAEVEVPRAFVFDKLTIHRSLTEIDLLCSVPMMKTHQLAKVTLGMKNLIGLYPGTVYQAVRGRMHDLASEVEPSGTAVAIVDMVRANKLGLVVIDGSTGMEGDGPTQGSLVKMGLIIAGTNPLATDMVGAICMGFEPKEIPTFYWANKAGLTPSRLDEIEIRGETLDQVRRPFTRPKVYTWKEIRTVWGAKEV